MMKYTTFLSLLCILFLTSSCDRNEDKKKDISRVVVFYMVAENSLVNGWNSDDIREILEASSTLKDDEEIVIYNDDNSTPAIYTINNRNKAVQLSELKPEYEYVTDQNSCSGLALSEFLNYVKVNHPANTYGMVFWSHGTGWIPSSDDADTGAFARRRSWGIDNGEDSDSDYGRQMSISELHNALLSFEKKFEYIFFDCCFMQCIEVDYELRDAASYIVASPAEIPAPGADYTTMVPALFENTDIANHILSAYHSAYVDHSTHGCLLSAVDCTQLESLAAVTRQMVSKYRDTLLSATYSDVLDYFQYNFYCWRAPFPDFFDMRGIFMTYLSADDFATWEEAFKRAIIASVHTQKWYSIYPKAYRIVDEVQYGGVSMYIPLEKYYTADPYYAARNARFISGYWASQWANAVWENKVTY